MSLAKAELEPPPAPQVLHSVASRHVASVKRTTPSSRSSSLTGAPVVRSSEILEAIAARDAGVSVHVATGGVGGGVGTVGGAE
jgi:hypothetical protein